MAEVVAAIGIVSNVLKFIDFGSKLCLRIRELSSSSVDRPGKLKQLEQRLRHVVITLEGLTDAGREALEHEQQAIEECLTHAKNLDALLKSFQKANAVFAAFRLVVEEKRIEELQQALERLVDLQLKVRIGVALDRNTAALAQLHNRICMMDENPREGQFRQAILNTRFLLTPLQRHINTFHHSLTSETQKDL
jgi:hypothetical protein